MRPLLAFATSWYQVLGIRLTDRVGKGIRSAPRDAMIADAVRVEERGLAFGFHRAMDHSGAVIGPLIGYALVVLLASDPTRPTTTTFKRSFSGFKYCPRRCDGGCVHRSRIAKTERKRAPNPGELDAD